MKFYNKFYFLIFFVCVLLFWKFFLRGLIPLPADTIVGMYHPWRDFYAKDYPSGIPFNNPLITDSVRQQFIWKKLVTDDYKTGQLPINNPYSFSGYPLLANFQSGAFYPLNLLFFILPFNFAWGAYIFLQFFLGALFMFWFLRSMLRNSEGVKATEESPHEQIAFIGSIVWILSGFWISWAEWGNILHTALWLPLILLSIDKMTFMSSPRTRGSIIWSIIYLFSLCFSFFAGHLQTFFYLYLFSAAYFLYRLRHKKNKIQIILLFSFLSFIFYLLTIPQWYPTLQFLAVSARTTDVQNTLIREDWFIPYQHLIQLFIPDYFGNPAKGNYWGVWNYGEFLSYVGIIPIFFAILGIIKSIKNRHDIFFLAALLAVFVLALNNPISRLSYLFQVPFFSTAQPSRIIFLLDFILIYFFTIGIKQIFEGKYINVSIRWQIFFFTLFILLFAILLFQFPQQQIILRNSLPPILIIIVFFIMMMLLKNIKYLLLCIFLLSFIDLSRVFWRYNTFAPQAYIFPETKTIKFLKQEQRKGFFRIASLDREIMPPNFAAYYKIRDIGGYDPLYYKAYAELFAGGKQQNFNRILQLTQVNENLFDILKVKYILTFADLPKSDFKLVFQEGKTKTYENLNYHPQL